MPKTKYGIWSLRLIVLFFIFLALFWLFIYAGYRGGDTFFSNPPLAISISLAGISGITSFLTGARAICFDRERSILVYLSTLLGFLISLFIFGELTPH